MGMISDASGDINNPIVSIRPHTNTLRAMEVNRADIEAAMARSTTIKRWTESKCKTLHHFIDDISIYHDSVWAECKECGERIKLPYFHNILVLKDMIKQLRNGELSDDLVDNFNNIAESVEEEMGLFQLVKELMIYGGHIREGSEGESDEATCSDSESS